MSHHRLRGLCALLILFVTISCSIATVVPGRLLIKLSATLSGQVARTSNGTIRVPTGNSDFDAILLQYRVDSLKPVFIQSRFSKNDPLYYKNQLDRHYVVDLKPAVKEREKLEGIAYQLTRTSAVETAECDFFMSCNYTPNDFFLQDATNGLWGLDSMHCRQGWDAAPNNNSIIVSVIDSGIEYNHGDINGNLEINTAEDLNHNGRYDPPSFFAFPPNWGDFNFVDDDGAGQVDDVAGWDFVDLPDNPAAGTSYVSGEDYHDQDNNPMDFDGHGTHCAGDVGAVSNNNRGVCSPSLGVRLIGVRAGATLIDSSVSNSPHGYTYLGAASSSVHYAIARGAKIISMSFGSNNQNNTLRDACQYANDHGVLVFAAAGNSNSTQTFYPAGYPGVIAVGATTRGYQRSSFSNKGNWVTLAAPGSDIISPVPGTNGHNAGYEPMSGTSMACPYAAGVAAYLWKQNNNLSAGQVKNFLIKGCTNISATVRDSLGAGQINLYNSLRLMQKPLVFAFPKQGDTIYYNAIIPIRFNTTLNTSSTNIRHYIVEQKIESGADARWTVLKQDTFSTVFPQTVFMDTINYAHYSRFPYINRLRVTMVEDTTIRDSIQWYVVKPVAFQLGSDLFGGRVYRIGDWLSIGTWMSPGYSGYAGLFFNRNYPTGAWEHVASFDRHSPNSQGWRVTGPATNNLRFALLYDGSLGGDTTWSDSRIEPDYSLDYPGGSPGGPSYMIGDTTFIGWTTRFTDNLNIEINRSYPSTNWERLFTNTPNDSSQQWVITGPSTQHARIRILKASDLTKGDTSDYDFVIRKPYELYSPNGGERLFVGNPVSIQWATRYTTNNVILYLNRNYPAGAWEQIHVSQGGATSYNWTPTLPLSGRARIKLIQADFTPADTSDADFVITDEYHVVSPNGGETYMIGSNWLIRWDTRLQNGNVNIDLNRSYPADTWEQVAVQVPNNGSYMWHTTPLATSTARIRILNSSNPAQGDTSDAAFNLMNLYQFQQGIAQPNGGEELIIDSTYIIRWRWPFMFTSVNIELNRNYPGGTWTRLFTNADNDSLPWVVTGPISNHARIRMLITPDTAAVDTSGADFSIVGTPHLVAPDTVFMPGCALYDTARKTIRLYNTGTDTLKVSRITVYQPVFQSPPSFTIAPHDSFDWNVSWVCYSTGTTYFSTTLYTNEPDSVNRIYMIGEILYRSPYSESFDHGILSLPPGGWRASGGTFWCRWSGRNNYPDNSYMSVICSFATDTAAYLSTPSFDLSTIARGYLSFDYCYSAVNPADYLQVWASVDNGLTYPYLLYSNGATGLLTQQNESLPQRWYTAVVTIPPVVVSSGNLVRFRFAGTPHYGGTIYLDNIIIDSVAAAMQLNRPYFDLTTIENYSDTVRSITIRNTGTDSLTLTVYDVPAVVATNWTSTSVRANDSTSLRLSWFPTATGLIRNSFRLGSNALGRPFVTLSFFGKAVTPYSMPNPSIPANPCIIVNANMRDIQWDSAANATQYKIYGGYGAYHSYHLSDSALATVSGTRQWTDTVTAAYKYYHITAVNNTQPRFSKTFDAAAGRNEHLFSVTQTFDGGFIATGTDNFWSTDRQLFIVRTDKDGNTIWSRRYSQAGIGNNIIPTDSGFIVTGYIGMSALFAYKIDSAGNIGTQYTANFPFSNYFYRFGALVDYDGGLLIAVQSGGTNAAMVLIKLNSQLQESWRRTYDITTNVDAAACIQFANDGGYLLGGVSVNTGAALVKVDSVGNLQWTRFYGGGGIGNIHEIIPDPVSGYRLFSYSAVSGGGDIIVIRTTDNGDTLWTRAYDYGGNEACVSATEAANNCYAFVVTNAWENTNGNVRLTLINESGTTIWTRVFDSGGDDAVRKVINTANGGFILAGASGSNSTTAQGSGWLIRLSGN